MPIFPFFRYPRPKQPAPQNSGEKAVKDSPPKGNQNQDYNLDVRRYFFNLPGSQTYASFFNAWNGWVTAGHVLSDTDNQWPDFVGRGPEAIWPGGLDAALIGYRLPNSPPPKPVAGQDVIVLGYPAGSRHIEQRAGTVYIERGDGSGTWIVHIEQPDEPVVVGMSGGPVIDAKSGEPIGILITRNSPADLNSDRHPDESCDFISLHALWQVLNSQTIVS